MKHYQYPYFQHHHVKKVSRKQARKQGTTTNRPRKPSEKLKITAVLSLVFIAGLIVGALS